VAKDPRDVEHASFHGHCLGKLLGQASHLSTKEGQKSRHRSKLIISKVQERGKEDQEEKKRRKEKKKIDTVVIVTA